MVIDEGVKCCDMKNCNWKAIKDTVKPSPPLPAADL